MRWSFRCFVEKMKPKVQGVLRITRRLFKWALMLSGCYFLVFGYWEVKKGPAATKELSWINSLPTNIVTNAYQASHFKYIRCDAILNRFSTDTNSIAWFVTQWRLERSSYVPMPRYFFSWWWWDAVRASDSNTVYYRHPSVDVHMWVLTNSGTCYIMRKGGF